MKKSFVLSSVFALTACSKIGSPRETGHESQIFESIFNAPPNNLSDEAKSQQVPTTPGFVPLENGPIADKNNTSLTNTNVLPVKNCDQDSILSDDKSTCVRASKVYLWQGETDYFYSFASEFCQLNPSYCEGDTIPTGYSFAGPAFLAFRKTDSKLIGNLKEIVRYVNNTTQTHIYRANNDNLTTTDFTAEEGKSFFLLSSKTSSSNELSTYTHYRTASQTISTSSTLYPSPHWVKNEKPLGYALNAIPSADAKECSYRSMRINNNTCMDSIPFYGWYTNTNPDTILYTPAASAVGCTTDKEATENPLCYGENLSQYYRDKANGGKPSFYAFYDSTGQTLQKNKYLLKMLRYKKTDSVNNISYFYTTDINDGNNFIGDGYAIESNKGFYVLRKDIPWSQPLYRFSLNGKFALSTDEHDPRFLRADECTKSADNKCEKNLWVFQNSKGFAFE